MRLASLLYIAIFTVACETPTQPRARTTTGRLELEYDHRTFFGDELELIVARIPVVADATYRFEVSYCCPWDYGIDVPFELTTTIE